MMKRGSSDLKLLVVLAVFSAVSGLLLALVNEVTKDRIAMVKVKKQEKALMEVVSKFDSVEVETLLAAPSDPVEMFTCRTADGKVSGVAVKLSTRQLSKDEIAKLGLPENVKQDQAYDAPIKMLVGFSADGRISGVSFLEHKETPGLGSNIEKKEFKSNYAGAAIDGKKWSVKKDGGDVEQLTAATISSRAVTGAVVKAIELFKIKAAKLGLK